MRPKKICCEISAWKRAMLEIRKKKDLSGSNDCRRDICSKWHLTEVPILLNILVLQSFRCALLPLILSMTSLKRELFFDKPIVIDSLWCHYETRVSPYLNRNPIWSSSCLFFQDSMLEKFHAWLRPRFNFNRVDVNNVFYNFDDIVDWKLKLPLFKTLEQPSLYLHHWISLREPKLH